MWTSHHTYCLEPTQLEQEHCNHLKAALRRFDESPKMGRDDFSKPYRIRLENDIDECYRILAGINADSWNVSAL